MQQVDLHASADHRVTAFPPKAAAPGVVITFSEFWDRKLHAPGFGEAFVLKHGYDLIVVKSARAHWFAGLPEAALAAIGAHLAATGRAALPRIGYGSSMGGYAALRFASALRLDRVLAISPQLAVGAPWDTRWQPDPGLPCPIPPVGADAIRPGCRIVAIYDPRDPDRLHAMRLSALVPPEDLTLLAVPYSGHPSGPMLKDGRLLTRIVLDAFAGRAPALARAAVRAARGHSASYLRTLGFACIQQRKHRWAAALLHRADAAEPEVFETICRLSYAYDGLGDADRAIGYALSALAMQPAHSAMLHKLCAMLAARDRLPEAVGPLERAIARQPEAAAFHQLLRNATQAARTPAPMKELELFTNGSHRITAIRQDAAPAAVVISFTEYSNRKLEGSGFGGRFVLEQGLDLVAVKTCRDNWHQDLPEAAFAAIVSHLEETGRGHLPRIGYGSSMGGYAAIKFSRRLGLARAVAISPQFDINQNWDTRYKAEADFPGTVEPIAPEDVAPDCVVYVAADPFDLDRLHVAELAKLIPPERLRVTLVPFAGHPAGKLLHAAGLLKEYSIAAFQGKEPKPDRARVRAARPHSQDYILAIADQCIARGKLRWAERICTRALAVKPDGILYTRLSVVQQRLGRYEEALDSAAEAVAVAPENVHLLKRWCSLLQGKGRLREALPALEAAQAAMPGAGLAPLLEQARAAPAVAPRRPGVRKHPAAAPVALKGFVERFRPDASVCGWVTSADGQGGGRDIELTVYLNGRQIGAGRPDTARADVSAATGHLAGFSIACTLPVPDEAVAFGTVQVMARRDGEPQQALKLWGKAQADAFARLFEQAELGTAAAAAIVAGLQRSKQLSPGARRALQALGKTHLGASPAAPPAAPAERMLAPAD